MSMQIRRRGAAAVMPVKIDVAEYRQRSAAATGKSVVSEQAKRMERRAVRKRRQRRLAARERYALMDKSERETSAAGSIQRACRAYKFKKILPVMLDCIRVARRWTPAMLFRLYTSLELKAEAERQATQLWGKALRFAPAMAGIETARPSKQGRRGYSPIYVLHRASIGSEKKTLRSCLTLWDYRGLPTKMPYGTWDFNGFSRHLHQQHWVTNIADDHSETSGQKSSTKLETSSSSGDSCASLYSNCSDPDSSVESTDDSISAPQQLVAMKKEGFENAMQDLACIVRPAGVSCECEGCTTGRSQEAELQRKEGTHMEKEIARLRTKTLTKELHTSWATIRLYFEILAPSAARLFASKACAAQDVFGAAWFSPDSRNALFENEQMLREIFLTLVGRQGDRDAINDPASVREGSGNRSEDTTVMKGLRADCRNNGFNHVWQRAIVEEQGRVGYLEVLRFCWDYGLHPSNSLLNNGEDNFLLAHLFVGASHSPLRVVPDEETEVDKVHLGVQHQEESCAKLTHLVPDKELDVWLAEQKLDQLFVSQDPALISLLTQLTEGRGKVSPVKVRDFVQEFILCSNRSLSPGELRTIVREMEASLQEAGTGDQITVQTCLRAVAHSCIFSDTVTSRRLSYGEFVSLFGALSQLHPGLSSSWRRAALHGITRQNLVTTGAVMGRFMSKIESIHPLLSKDAVRGERTRRRSDETIPGRKEGLPGLQLPANAAATLAASGADSFLSRRSVAIRRKRRRAGTAPMAPGARPLLKTASRDLPRGSKTTASFAPMGRKSTKISGSKGVTRGSTTTTNGIVETDRRSVNLGRSSKTGVKGTARSKIRRTVVAVSAVRTKPFSSFPSPSGRMPSALCEAPVRDPRRASAAQDGRVSSSSSSPSSSICDSNASGYYDGEPSAPTTMSPLGGISKKDAVRRVEVTKELDSALRSAFDRYAALERRGAGFLEASDEGRGVSSGSLGQDHTRINSSPGHTRDSVPAAPTTRKSGAPASMPSRGRLSPRTLPIMSSSASPPSPLAGEMSLNPCSAKPPVPSTVMSTAEVATLPLTVSIDGLVLFIYDTNIFPMLCFESITATAAEEVTNEPRYGSVDNPAGRLDVDRFVRVCLQLMRDNFLVAALGYQHRVEALSAEQRVKEWEKRHPGTTEHADLLQRLRGWMEQYRLPSRMAAFKRNVFAIGCPTETRPRTAKDNSGGRGRRKRKSPASMVPHPGPCLIDLWTGQTVARNAVEVSSSSTSGRIVKVDDEADRALLNQITDMMVDLAAPASFATSATSPATGRVDRGGGIKTPEAAADQAMPLAGENPPSTEESVDDRDFAATKTPVQRDIDVDDHEADDGTDASDTDDFESCDAGDSPEKTGGTTLNGPNVQAALIDGRGSTSSLAKEGEVDPDQGNNAEQTYWNGLVTAREIAKKARAHQLHVSDTVVRILGRICPVQPEPTKGPPLVQKPSTSAEEDVDLDANVKENGEKEAGSASDTSSDASTERSGAAPVPIMTPDDYTTLPNTHPAQQLLEAGKELMRLKRPEQALVVWDQAAEILRGVDKVDPRQSLVVLLQLAWTMQKLGRFQDIPPVLLQATESASTIASWKEHNRLSRNRRLEATIMAMLGFSFIKVKSFERALEVFRGMHKRLRGEELDQVGFKGQSDGCHSPRAKSNEGTQPNEAELTTREDVELWWQARRGLSTSLVGLGRGKEALAEASEAMDLAEQLAVPAIRAECEGLSGRAWRSVAVQTRGEGRRQQSSAGFDALYGQERDDGEEQESEDDDSSEQTSSDESEDEEDVKSGLLSIVGSQKSEQEVSSYSQQREHRPYRTREYETESDFADGPSAESDLNRESIIASERKAAGCFKRQVALLRGLDRSSHRLPPLEPELDFSIGDDGISASPTSLAEGNRSKTSKRVQRIQEYAHVSEVQALTDLGKTALSLGEVDAAVLVFKRRLRLAERRCSGSATTLGDINRGQSSMLVAAIRPLSSPHLGWRRVPTRPAGSYISPSRSALDQCGPMAAPRATQCNNQREDSLKGALSNAARVERDEPPSLDVAEALWWFAVSMSEQHLGIDPASSPRFMPFNVRPRRPSTCGCDRASKSRGSAAGLGERSVDRRATTPENGVAVAPAKPALPRDSEEEKTIRARTCNGMNGVDCAAFPCGGGERHNASLPSPAPRKIRPSSCKASSSPGAYLKDGTLKSRRRKQHNTRHSESRLGNRGVCEDGEAERRVSPCQGGPEPSGLCFAAIQESTRFGGAACGEQSSALGAVVTVGTGWPAEEAPDGVVKDGPLWRDSGFGRVTVLILDGVPQGIAEACQPVIECLQRQLSIALGCDAGGDVSLLNSHPCRKQAVTRDALMGLGTMGILCGDDCGGYALYERAAECCRSSGDWIGMANALAAKARLHMATGCFAEAGRGFGLVLKLAYELSDDILAASAHSFQGWVMASQRDVQQALSHFRQCRKLSFKNKDDSAAAASELAIAHMHLRLATASHGGNVHHRNSDNASQPGIAPAFEVASHMELVAARRHYLRYLRWTQARDTSGVSHAHMCLARMYQAMEDEESFEHHRQASLQGCCWRTGTDDQSLKMRALDHEGAVREMLELE